MIDSKHASHTCDLSLVEVEAGGSEAQGYPSLVGLRVTLSQKTKQSNAHPHLDLNRINTDRSCALTLVASCFTLSKSGSPSSATGHPDNQVLPPLTSDLSASYSPPATRPCCVYQLRRLLPWSRLGMGVSCSWNVFFPSSICLAHSYNPFKSCVNVTLSVKLTSMLLTCVCPCPELEVHCTGSLST